MCWAVVACAAVSTFCAHGKSDRESDSEQMARQLRERDARVAAETRKTLRDAQVFTGLLLAFVATAAYGVAQLFGMV